jgi:hypothetical protein
MSDSTDGRVNIRIKQGATFSLPISMKNVDAQGVEAPVNLTGYTARGQIRKDYDSKTALAALAFTGAMDATGTFAAALTATQTALLPRGRWVYDIEVFMGDIVVSVIYGNVTVYPEATK